MSPRQRWKTPDAAKIEEVFRRAEAKLRKEYPGATIRTLPMNWEDVLKHEPISSVYFLGLISAELAGRQVSYAVRWDAREERGRLTIEH